MRRGSWLVLAVLAVLLIPATLFATTINVGIISFDTLIPGGATAGSNVFNISNLTDAFQLPPDFPVAAALTFHSSSLMLVNSVGTSTTIPLGDIGPGSLAPTTPVEFPDTSL